MPKFAGKTAPKTAPIRTTSARTATYEGGPALERDAKSALFLLAVANMVGEDTFYESAADRDNRFKTLIHQVVAEDPDWVARFVPYLRGQMRMRSASVVMAAEYVKAGGPNGRAVVASALQRPDEPAEMLGYWHSNYGRSEPMPVKRGVADAVRRMYNERGALKYDGSGRPWRFGQVIERVHAKPVADWQAELFLYLVDRAHGRQDARLGESLSVTRANRALWQVPPEQRKAMLEDPTVLQETFAAAGMTWEDASSWVNGPLTAKLWEAIIPSMGAMALVRNLRNFDGAEVSDTVANKVMDVLRDADAIERSRQLPFRFYTAWRELGSLRWGAALESALEHSTASIPELAGRTLILFDTSGSMTGMGISRRSTVTPMEQACVFAFSLAKRQKNVEVYSFADRTKLHPFKAGDSVLRAMGRVRNGEVGHGTAAGHAVQTRYDGHDRVIVVSDMQTADQMPALKVPMYTFNIGGYAPAYAPEGKNGVYTFGGLSDSAFQMLPLLEAGKSADWPF